MVLKKGWCLVVVVVVGEGLLAWKYQQQCLQKRGLMTGLVPHEGAHL